MNQESRSRLVERKIARGERQLQALAVARADQDGLVDGVHVDFRHSDIPPGEWEAREFWSVGANSESHCGFLFPSEAAHCDDIPESERDEHHCEALSLPRALPGDRLTIEAVEERISDRRFDHPHDAVIKAASLVLRRSSGEEIRPSSPLLFFGITQFRDGPHRDAYDRLASRVLSENGWPNTENFEEMLRLWPEDSDRLIPSKLNLSERAALSIGRSERAWRELVEHYIKDDTRGLVLLRQAMGAAVLAAFYQAKHESQPAEEKQQRLIEGGKKRTARAKDSRFRIAQDFWDEQPDLKMGVLSRKVIAKLWEDDEIKELIGEKTMIDSLKAAIRRGDLNPPETEG